MTVTDKTIAGSFVLRDLILRIYWDDESTPSVESPLGDFFCNGFGTRCEVNSLPIVVNPTSGMNCYFEMPFRKKAKITLTNEHPEFIKHIFYTFNYALTEVPDDAMYFHAKWNREPITTKGKDYTLIDGIKGTGYYVGTYFALCALERYWWGEGEFKFYIDGDEDFPTITSTGAEDYLWAILFNLKEITPGIILVLENLIQIQFMVLAMMLYRCMGCTAGIYPTPLVSKKIYVLLSKP